MNFTDCERLTRKISGTDELWIKNYDVKNKEWFNLGLNFRQRIGNYALSLSSDIQYIDWDSVLILIEFKNEKKKLFEAVFQVIFFKKDQVIYSVKNIGLEKHTYKPFII